MNGACCSHLAPRSIPTSPHDDIPLYIDSCLCTTTSSNPDRNKVVKTKDIYDESSLIKMYYYYELLLWYDMMGRKHDV